MPKMVTREKSDYGRKVQEKAVIEKRAMAIERDADAADADAAHAPPPPRVRRLELTHGQHLDATLYRLEKGCYLQFNPGPTLLGRKVFLYTNYVVTEGDEEKGEQAEFVRNQYYGLEWWRGAAGDDDEWAPPADADADAAPPEPLGAGALVTDTGLRCRLRLARPGCYHYYFVYDTAESSVGPQGSGWFQVAPTLRVGPGGREELPLDAVACQTVLAKCLGPLPRWESTLRVTKEAGYNMIHFTPVQELGGSGSSYSIANQLRLNPAFGGDGREATFADVENLVSKMRSEWKVLSICDVVLNHTANETPWLAEHPEATYNCATCPHLRPAALLDALLARLSRDVARGDYEARGVPPRLTEHHHLDAVRHVLETQLIPEARLHEMFMCDVNELVQEFYFLARNKVPAVAAAEAGAEAGAEGERALRLEQDPQYRRLRCTVDLDRALQLYNVYRAECYDEESRLRRCCEALKRRLEQLNDAAAACARDQLRAAVDNCLAGLRYHRLQADGPRIAEVSDKHPLVPRYFTWSGLEAELFGAGGAALEAALLDERGARVMAHNGWVMDADPLADFARAPAQVYLRRELLAWADSVKLRYGERPEDSPFLWAAMQEYVELTAEVFDGLRLDNCHSTPLHVAEHMLDCARNVKPDLYVVAELFTNSDHVDNIFVNRLGITALIREAQSAWDAREQGRLLHRFGARPVGAWPRPPTARAAPSVARAMLLDLTHDNPSPLDKRSVWDVLPTAACVAAAAAACGSTRGLDELVPHHVHVVDETRLYPSWAEAAAGEGTVDGGCGIIEARRVLNELHASLAREGYSELYVDQMDDDVIAVTRHHPLTRQSVIVVALTAFRPPAEHAPRAVRPLRFEGELDEILFEMELRPTEHQGQFSRDARYINGLAGWRAHVRRAPACGDGFVGGVACADGVCELALRPMRPGSVLALRTRLAPDARAAARELQALVARVPAAADALGVAGALRELDLVDLNAVLYRCDAEERAAGGPGVYDVPGHGPLVYAGLQGVASLLEAVCESDDLGHAVCDNLRAGDWLLEYTWRRLEREPRLAALAARARGLLAPVARLPRYLRPAYGCVLLRALHAAAARAALARMHPARGACAAARALALASVQLTAAVASAPLPPPSPALPPPRPRAAALSAGLPHFAVGHMRCWGRDTFISLRGLYLLTGRFQDARAHILAFAACLRHGLIPNLLDGGRNARYNCRDAVWWWLHSIQQYCTEAPQGHTLLTEPVSRLFPTDEAEAAPPGAADQPLHDVLQEALDVHFQGLAFRERRAGRAIDAHMADKGFNVQIGIDPETGFPFGGNDANCGTWMDKMGSSEAAGTRGTPATPRDGSAVELVALAYSAAAWLAAMHRAGRYPHAGLVRRHRDGRLTSWTWTQWAERLRAHFERAFWVPAAPGAHDQRPDLVHRRGVYRDTHGASRAWADYQLRCNFVVAMAVAPALFDARHAWLALDNVERLLLGPLGLKTLDPADWAYRPDYDNADDGTDPAVAHGYNYHQGPEWVWPLGFYVRARLAFAHENGRVARTVAAGYAALGPAVAELRASPWRGLPELTNAGGAPCAHSCLTQAWSAASALEALHALDAARRARPLAAD